MIRKKKEIETAINFKTSAVQNNETRQKKLNLFAVKNQKKLYLLYHSLFFFFLFVLVLLLLFTLQMSFFPFYFSYIYLFIYFPQKNCQKSQERLQK